jgi:DNA polymerase III gamma/tau subunit
MLPTTRSRCQHVRFAPLPTDFLAERLAALRSDVPGEQRGYVSRRAAGSLGAALMMLDDGLYELKRSWGERIPKIANAGDRIAPHEMAKPMLADAKVLAKCVTDRDSDVSETDALRHGLRELLSVIAAFYADALRDVTHSELEAINSDQREAVAALAAGRSFEELAAALTEIAATESNIALNAHPELALEAMLIRLAGISLHRRAV